MSWRYHKLRLAGARTNDQRRMKVLAVFFMVFAVIIVIRLFDLQILRGGFYAALALGQHELYQKLFPERGSIYVMEDNGGVKSLFPLVTNQDQDMLYAVPQEIEKPEEVAEKLFAIFGLNRTIDWEKVEKELFVDIAPDLEPKMAAEIKAARREKWLKEQEEIEKERLIAALAKEKDPYEPLYHRLTIEQSEAVKNLNIKGLGLRKETWRLYAEKDVGGHILGFWGFNENDERNGRYGLEGYYDQILAGRFGEIRSERDAWGNIIAIGDHSLKEKVDGSDLVLTIDRAIQYKTCQALYRAVDYFKASGGSVIVINPKTGAILAMCGAPDFDPDQYNQVEEIEAYNNPAIFLPYEPGSIFKPITMAAALDAGKVEPDTTYEDTGSISFYPYTIYNFARKVYGKKTMTEVLQWSINTGVIYAMRQITPSVFIQYVKNFDFGKLTGIELDSEAAGDISNLDKTGEVYAATASFGQGISVTPLQILKAIAAVANGGKMMKPYIVSQIINPDNQIQTFYPTEIRQVISAKAAAMLSGMMVSVVESGYGKEGRVAGYRLAGKTGTAQIPNKNGPGYSDDVITSFVGFGPFADPKFAMIVRVDKPQWGKTGESVAAPVFKEIAQFILQYYNVPQDAK